MLRLRTLLRRPRRYSATEGVVRAQELRNQGTSARRHQAARRRLSSEVTLGGAAQTGHGGRQRMGECGRGTVCRDSRRQGKIAAHGAPPTFGWFLAGDCLVLSGFPRPGASLLRSPRSVQARRDDNRNAAQKVDRQLQMSPTLGRGIAT